MIEFKNVSIAYQEDVYALEGISFTISKGEIFGVVGESGAGKSSLLRLINQLETQTHGTVNVNGIDIQKLKQNEKQSLRQNIAMIFQDFNLLGNLNVYDNVALPLKLRGHVDARRVAEVLAFVKLDHKASAYPKTLSGGEKQRVAIARALVTNPDMILCDEPTSALDPKTSQDILDVLRNINQTFNTTLVFVSHDLYLTKAICDRVAILNQGHLYDIVDVKSNTNASVLRYAEHARDVLTQ